MIGHAPSARSAHNRGAAFPYTTHHPAADVPAPSRRRHTCDGAGLGVQQRAVIDTLRTLSRVL